MRSDISTIESEFTKEQIKFIRKYLKFVRDQLNNPTKPEIHIGAARYPIGRFVIKKSIIDTAIKNMEKYKENPHSPEALIKMDSRIKSLQQVKEITDSLKQRGKTIKKHNRKNDNNKTN